MKKLGIVTAIISLSACTVGPDYLAPDQAIGGGWFSAQRENVSEESIQTRWWENFNDPVLSGYIQQASRNNKDIHIALANVMRARAVRREVGGALYPQVGADAQASRAQSSKAASSAGTRETRNLYDAGFDASWELDLFGGSRRETEAADARLGAEMAGYHDVMLTTFSDVARRYYEARGYQKQIHVTTRNIQLLEQTLDLIEKRRFVGEANEFDVARARGELQANQARLPNLQADMEASVFALSVLLGLTPEALISDMQESKPLPAPPDMVPVGLRADLLRRRPDIRLAERELAASSADIGAATADLFPQFFITGDLGSQARVFGDLFTAAGGLWSLAAAMQWSVFEGGAIRARIDIEKAENKAALAAYEKTVLEALADVETALTRYGREVETRKRLQAAVQSRQDAAALAQKLLDVGEADYLSVLDAQRELIASEDDLVASETQAIIKLVALYTALGGGWDMPASSKIIQ